MTCYQTLTKLKDSTKKCQNTHKLTTLNKERNIKILELLTMSNYITNMT